jgi:hypothetical protein
MELLSHLFPFSLPHFLWFIFCFQIFVLGQHFLAIEAVDSVAFFIAFVQYLKFNN